MRCAWRRTLILKAAPDHTFRDASLMSCVLICPSFPRRISMRARRRKRVWVTFRNGRFSFRIGLKWWEACGHRLPYGIGGYCPCGMWPQGRCGARLVSPSFLLPWAKLAPALSTAPTEEGSQIGSIVGLWLVTFECDGAVWDVGFDQWHRDGTDLNT